MKIVNFLLFILLLYLFSSVFARAYPKVVGFVHKKSRFCPILRKKKTLKRPRDAEKAKRRAAFDKAALRFIINCSYKISAIYILYSVQSIRRTDI